MRSLRRQAGFSLLLYVLMVMAMGGFLLEGYLQRAREEAETRKEQFDRDVLMQAKAALLQYAYNYPEIIGNGPGRLPCSDTDNDGESNTLFGVCDDLGRFPFNEPLLNTTELRDSSGERLWYAPATTYMQLFGGAINSDSAGTITIKDQAGQVLYDGAVDGVAAVIIAPGPVIDRNGTLQDRQASNGDDPDDLVTDTDPAIVNPVNYLDLNGAQDNATMTHLDSDDGFQLGPVTNASNKIVINDRILFITAEELNAAAEKAVLQEYSRSIRAWQKKIWSAPSDYRLPWLDDYSIDSLSELLETSKSLLAGQPVMGRIPTVNGKYFVGNQKPNGDPYSTDPVAGDLRLKVVTGSMPPIDFAVDLPGSVKSLVFDSPDIKMDLIVNIPAGAAAPLFVVTDNPVNASSTWQVCPPVSGGVSDCARDSAGNFIPGQPNELSSVVRELKLEFASGDQSLSLEGSVALPGDFSSVPASTTIEPPRGGSPGPAMDAMIYPSLSASGATKVKDSIIASSAYDEYQYPPSSSGSAVLTASDQALAIADIEIGVSYYPETGFWIGTSEDDWIDSVMLAYSPALSPGGSGSCTLGVDCLEAMHAFDNSEHSAVLVNAGQTANGLTLQSELPSLFDSENADGDYIFDARPAGGDDSLMVLQ